MTYELLIGDRSYSSWSLRGWLLLEGFGLESRSTLVRMYDPAFKAALVDWPPARTVPVVRKEGVTWSDTIAIAEGLAEAHPDAGHWPRDPAARALARSMVAEMHSGFSAIRSACPMNMRVKWVDFPVTDEICVDLDRLQMLWDLARTMATDGPWLFGDYSAVDAFFAPVAMRIAGYGLPVDGFARDYVETQLGHAPLRRWRAMGEANDRTLDVYDQGLATTAFPIPRSIPAQAVDAGPSVNAACPYSGDPVTDFAQIGGRVWGFCNPFCRDKTVSDAGAWPAFMAIYQS